MSDQEARQILSWGYDELPEGFLEKCLRQKGRGVVCIKDYWGEKPLSALRQRGKGIVEV